MYEELINEGGARTMRERWGSRRLRWKASQRVMTQKGKTILWTKDSVDPDVCSSLLTVLTLNQGSASPSEASVLLIHFGARGNIFTRSDLRANFLVWTGVCQSPAPGTKRLHIWSVMFERTKNAYKREIQKIYLQRAKGDKPAARVSRVCCCADTERRVNSWINSIWAQRTLPIRSPAFGNPTLTPSGGLFLGPDESFCFVIVINYSIITV